MTIKELIDELSKYDPNLPVFMNDSEWIMFEVSKVIHSSEITWLDEYTKEFLKLPPSEFLFLEPEFSFPEPMDDDDSKRID